MLVQYNLNYSKDSSDKQRIQDTQYSFPYHHIPDFDDRGVPRRIRALEWGLEYLCYLRHIQELVYSLNPFSVLEVGCGDGRFIGMLGSEVKSKVGVDLSEKAISFAKAFYPNIDFRVSDIREMDETFDAVLAIEVLEHIPDDQISWFVKCLEERTNSNGYVIICVPSTVLPLNKKHFRHYDLNTFEKQLFESGANLEIINVDYIYKNRHIVNFLLRAMMNRFFLLEITFFNDLLWKYVWKHLRITKPNNGRRIVILCKKPED
jgi:2-polyprenyl-3-methyl-5-hydroxy-6-metoxy-1,4-benzoquinol methylase